VKPIMLVGAAEHATGWEGRGSTVLPRSRLYRLLPCGRGTTLTESLTGYVNRLAWRHHVAAQRFVVQEIVPRLGHPSSPRQVSGGSWANAMSLNGNGPQARAWVALLEEFTACADLHRLTWAPWVGDLQPAKLLRAKPAWCAACYAEWRDQGLPLYEPLIWTLQVVSLCPRHARPLDDRCPACQRPQTAIRSHLAWDRCAQCQTWLGSVVPLPAAPSPAEMAWQAWVWHALEELRSAATAGMVPAWDQFFLQLRTSCAARGAQFQLARLAGLSSGQFGTWLRRSQSPTLRSILAFCYVCDVTPLQVLTGDLSPLKRVLQAGKPAHAPQPRRRYQAVDPDRCRQRFHAILTGQEEPLASRRLAAQLGYSGATLHYHFPQECARLSQLFKEYRRQRKAERAAQLQEGIRQAALALHVQGVYPSLTRVGDLLPNAKVFLDPEVRATLRAIRRELGWDP
jgi:TniQ